MREIIFRGQTRRKGEKVHMDGTPVESNWVYGGIFQGANRSIIYGYDPIEKHVVYSDTVGQYTGLNDKNGQRIFEGDILYTKHGIRYITFENGCFGVRANANLFSELRQYNRITNGFWEVIGNIHDNLELLKGDS